ncbi:MAG: hypothetical protein ACI4B5_09110 [Bacteroidaceae bacterium]
MCSDRANHLITPLPGRQYAAGRAPYMIGTALQATRPLGDTMVTTPLPEISCK